eukprot:scaffold1.g5771.t1
MAALPGLPSDWTSGAATALDSVFDVLGALESILRSGGWSRGEVLQWWRTADPLGSAVAAAVLVSLIVWLLSLPTNRHSWVDKSWSLLPIAYAWHFALHDHMTAPEEPVHPRLAAMAALVTVWGVRLTWNFWRKGGYRWRDEDYRWPALRAAVHPLLFELFSIVFIALYQASGMRWHGWHASEQNLLLLFIVTPMCVAWAAAPELPGDERSMPFGPLDAAATALCAFFILFEAVADQQQWNFQTAKRTKIASGEQLTGERRAQCPLTACPRCDYARGFLTSGLWRYSRHPNFFAEQAFWWSLYLFSVAATGEWINWSLLGPIQLSLLFQGSTPLTERITSAKYPAYKDYQRATSRLVPLWARSLSQDVEQKAPRRQPASAKPRGKKAAAAPAEVPATPAPAPAAAEKQAGAATHTAKPAAAEEQAGGATPARTPAARRGAGRAAKSAAKPNLPTEAPTPLRSSSRLRAKQRA